MRVVLTVLTLLAVQVIERFGQTQTKPDFDNLYERASESAYVVRGRVLDRKATGARTRISKELEEQAKMGMRIEIPIQAGGTLFTVAVTQTVCRQSDFALGAAQEAPPAGVLSVFVPRGEPAVRSKFDPYRLNISEHLLPGREYLLFLRKDPPQADLADRYQLDAGGTYYRTFEGDRGAVLLPDLADQGKPRDFATPLASGVTVLCDAVKAPDVETKIRNLSAVKDRFGDPAWRKSVDAAINALQKAQAQATQPR